MIELKKSEWEEIKKVLSKYGIWYMDYVREEYRDGEDW